MLLRLGQFGLGRHEQLFGASGAAAHIPYASDCFPLLFRPLLGFDDAPARPIQLGLFLVHFRATRLFPPGEFGPERLPDVGNLDYRRIPLEVIDGAHRQKEGSVGAGD